MVTKSLILVLTLTFARAQMDGKFWWLSEKLDKYRKPPPKPTFEELDSRVTDESVKLVFNDSLPKSFQNDKSNNIVFRDDNSLSKENHKTRDKIDCKVRIDPTEKSAYKRKFTDKINLSKLITKEPGDIFFFTFPDKIATKTPTKISNSNVYDTNYGNETSITTNLKDQGTQSICTFIKKKECNNKNGTVHYFGFER